MDYREELLEQYKKADEGVMEVYNTNKERIDSFFERFVGAGLSPDEKFEVKAEDIKLLHDTIQMVARMKEDAQISAVTFGITEKELQKTLYRIVGESKNLITE